MNSSPKRGHRLAIVTTHPTQYNAPWFRWMAASSLDLKVFYLWDFGVSSRHDPGFGHELKWDVPLLDGYEYEFVPNISANSGTSRFGGIRNPELLPRLRIYAPTTALLIGYRYPSFLRIILLSQRRRGFPLVFRGDSHRLVSESRGLRSEVRRRIISSIYRRFGAVLYVGQANYDYFRFHDVAESRLFFSPHAVDNERFMGSAEAANREAAVWRASLGIPEYHFVVMFAGKFEIKKRPFDLLEAFRRLHANDVSLLFVGAGQLEPKLRACAGSVSNVFFAPFQNQSQMPRTYAACDLFVLPSFGGEESWGLAVNEALCLAKPVVVSTHIGCGPDLVRPNENGLIFVAGNVAALAAALREALSDPGRLRRWGDAGREIVSTYNYERATSGLEQAIASVVEHSP